MFKKPPTKKHKGESLFPKEDVTNDGVSDGEMQQYNANQRNKVIRRRRNAARTTTSSSSDSDDERDNDEANTSELLAQWKTSRISKNNKQQESKFEEPKKRRKVGHEFQPDTTGVLSAQEMATRVAEYHPEEKPAENTGEIPPTGATSEDIKIYRGQIQQQNKFLAGPLRAPTFVRTTCRFDYQPDICKDYKETGFCGFGDTCIYLHDRGDTLTGWQLERQWEEKRKKEAEMKEQQMNRFMDGEKEENKIRDEQQPDDDGIPFACYICRGPFTNPIATTCGHYFCSKCIMDSFVKKSPCCPICSADTGGVFNHPSKLFAKKRRVVGKDKDWKEYANAFKFNAEPAP